VVVMVVTQFQATVILVDQGVVVQHQAELEALPTKQHLSAALK
tara:strand:+ start:181 stop:309 length:129 start_codon:yes stop_codon:yes gene_type:complete